MAEFDYLDDRELFDKLQKAGLAEALRNSPEWSLVREAARRIVDRAVEKFAIATKADDVVGIVELQATIRKYKFGLFEEIGQLVQEGEIAFEEAKSRGLFKKT